MSKYYLNYSQYLGAQKCCDIRTQGPAGPQGPPGPSAIGPKGPTGDPGMSFTGPTGRGCRGPTGPSGGPTGPTGSSSLWSNVSPTGIGYTGNLYVYADSISTNFVFDSAGGSTNIGDISNAFDGVNILVSGSGNQISLDSRQGTSSIGDVNNYGSSTKMIIDDSATNVNVNCAGNVTIGDYSGQANGQYLQVNNTNQNISISANNGLNILKSTIQYTSSYNTSNQNLDITSSYSQTFNGAGLTATLPTVSSSNVGIQFLITNINASNLTVSASGGQLIYSSTGLASTASRTLNSGNSQIFTAILTGVATYGWSMV